MNTKTLLLSKTRGVPAIWERAAVPLLSPTQAWETTSIVNEPSVIYENGTWKMWYTGGYSSPVPALGYATCTGDPTVTGNWTKYAGNPVLGRGAVVAGWVSGTNVAKIGSTYYAYYYDADGGGNLKVSTSSDGITWNTPTTAIASNAAAWVSGWANSFVWYEGGTTWKMLAEGRSTGTGTPWTISYATSTDGLSWSVVGSGPLTSLKVSGQDSYSGPWLANSGALINGRYQLWYHAGTGNFSDIYQAWSTDGVNWTQTRLQLAHNGGTYETQQAADPSVVEQGNVSYLFYGGVDNTPPSGYVNVARYQGTLSTFLSSHGQT